MNGYEWINIRERCLSFEMEERLSTLSLRGGSIVGNSVDCTLWCYDRPIQHDVYAADNNDAVYLSICVFTAIQMMTVIKKIIETPTARPYENRASQSNKQLVKDGVINDITRKSHVVSHHALLQPIGGQLPHERIDSEWWCNEDEGTLWGRKEGRNGSTTMAGEEEEVMMMTTWLLYACMYHLPTSSLSACRQSE